mgnify:CR=1 FL=1
MIDYIRSQDWCSQSEKFQKKVEEACSILSHKQMREPDVNEVADYLELPVKRWKTTLNI